jgi:PilZ domain
MDERRSRPRLSVNLEAVWDSESDNHPALITDLSLGGCYLNTVGETRTGETVGFRVLLPDGDWLYVQGEVRHHTAGRGFGVQFADLAEEQQEKIEWLLRLALESGGRNESIAANLVEE